MTFEIDLFDVMDSLNLTLIDKVKKEKALDILSGLSITQENAEKLRQVFEKELENGLQGGLDVSSLQMENTYVSELTNGKENGKFLALDLGGTNFRVMLLEINCGVIEDEKVSYYMLDDSTRLGPGTELFDFLAECVMDFIKKHQLDINHDVLPLGFTFSFPMVQQGLGKIFVGNRKLYQIFY